MNAYQDLIIYERLTKELEKQTGVRANKAKEYLDEMKRKIRRANKATNYRFSEGETVFANEFESAIFKYPLPAYLTTFEEAEEYFDEYERLYFIASPYDCTGQHFTSWRKIFRKPDGRFWVYHSIGMDV